MAARDHIVSRVREVFARHGAVKMHSLDVGFAGAEDPKGAMQARALGWMAAAPALNDSPTSSQCAALDAARVYSTHSRGLVLPAGAVPLGCEAGAEVRDEDPLCSLGRAPGG